MGVLKEKINKKGKSNVKLKLTNVNDIKDRVFGKLTVLEFDHEERKHYKSCNPIHYYYKVRCECGNIFVTDRNHLMREGNHSCGCDRKADIMDVVGKQMGPWYVDSYDHYDAETSTHYYKCKRKDGSITIVSRSNIKNHDDQLYRKYHSMKSRCLNPSNDSYSNYGGRGIKICDRWLGEDGFAHFKEDMYDKYIEHVEKYGEDNTTLDRINVDGDYEPNNCRWATWQIQQNNRTSNRNISYNGETLSLSDCVAKYAAAELSYSLILSRLSLGWDIERALHEPVNNRKLLDLCTDDGFANIIHPFSFSNGKTSGDVC